MPPLSAVTDANGNVSTSYTLATKSVAHSDGRAFVSGTTAFCATPGIQRGFPDQDSPSPGPIHIASQVDLTRIAALLNAAFSLRELLAASFPF